MYYPNSQHPHYHQHQRQLEQQRQLDNLQRQQRRKRHNILLTLLSGLWYTLVTLLAVVGFAVLLGGVVMAYTGTLPFQPSARQRLVRAAQTLGIPDKPFENVPTPPRRPVIYLNREGGTLTAGHDDSTNNVSSVVAAAGLEEYEVPAFRSTPQRWDAIVSCVEGQFEDFDVEIVDQRPIDGTYIMVMIGGEPDELASRTGHVPSRGSSITGLAPLGNRVIDDAVVFVFSREVREQTRAVCESVTHEVGHAFGLDHVMDCHDPMTHLASCGQRTFQDEERVCGEREPRECVNGQTTQNSHGQLLEIVGPSDQLAAEQAAAAAAQAAQAGRLGGDGSSGRS